MAASVKCKWILKKCAKFVYLGETDNSEDFNEEREALDVSCKGEWKLYPGENNDLILYYLESDHFLLTKKNVILESFSLPCSKSYLKGVAKADTLLMSCTLQEGKKRQFRVQFAEQDGEDGTAKRKECTNMLKKFIHVVDYSSEGEGSEPKKITDVSDVLLEKMHCLKGYAVNISEENLKEILTLCLTDSAFPMYVARIDEMMRDFIKQ